MTTEKMADDITLYTIASVKSYNYMMEYDPNSGIEVERLGANFLKQGYIDGFIAGFTHRLTEGSND
jgi:hypothetical protein